jgi:hypothetical protein
MYKQSWNGYKWKMELPVFTFALKMVRLSAENDRCFLARQDADAARRVHRAFV